MDRTLHALIVGIDIYPKHRHLSSSVRVANEMWKLLNERLPSDILSRSNLLPPLTNEKATRKAIISRLKNMASSVRSGDICLFHYAGHGSQEYAPKELCETDDGDVFETLLCFDSRSNDHDLADKEIACLIAEISHQKNIHFVAIMDCCHSGDNTKTNEMAPDPRINSVNINPAERPASSYYGYKDYKPYPPVYPHIALSACQPNDVALDGFFSDLLIAEIRKDVKASYKEIINKVRTEMIKARLLQKPGILSSGLGDRPFLDGILA